MGSRARGHEILRQQGSNNLVLMAPDLDWSLTPRHVSSIELKYHVNSDKNKQMSYVISYRQANASVGKHQLTLDLASPKRKKKKVRADWSTTVKFSHPLGDKSGEEDQRRLGIFSFILSLDSCSCIAIAVSQRRERKGDDQPTGYIPSTRL